MATPTTQQAEQEALSNILKSPTEGGSASGTLGAGADVPAVLNEDPALRQLLQENIYTQTGQADKAIASSAEYQKQAAPAVMTSEIADTRNTENQNELAGIQTGLEESNANTSGTTTQKTTTGASTTGGEEIDPLQGKIDAANAAVDAEVAQMTGLLDARMSSLSASSQAQIESIKATFEARRAETRRLNEILLQSNTKAGIRAGRQRYAAEINSGILTGIEQDGIRRIAALDAQEMELINAAQSASDTNQFNLLSQKMDMLHTARKEKEQAIADLNKAAMEQEMHALDKAKKERELKQFDREDASQTIDAMVTAGVDPSTIPSDYFTKLDVQSGYAVGTSEGLFEFGQKEKLISESKDAAEIEMMQIDQAAALNSMLMELPVGLSVSVGGTEYTSRNKGEISVFTEYNGKGDMNIVSYNQDTKEYSTTTVKGVAPEDGWEFEEKNGVGMFINPNTQEYKVAYDSNQPDNGNTAGAALLEAYPVGSVGGQCGAWVREVTGYDGPGISAIPAKEKLVTDFGFEVNASGVPQGTIKPGMAFIMNDVGYYGHVGIVNSATRLPDGTYSLNITDSNWGMNEKIQNRTINSRDVYGFADLGMKDEYRSGTDGGSLNEDEAVNRYFGGATPAASGAGVSDEYVLDLVTATDKKEMIKAGLNPESADDIRKYITDYYKEEDPSSSLNFDNL